MRVQNQTKYITTPIIIGTHKTTITRTCVRELVALSVFCWLLSTTYFIHVATLSVSQINENTKHTHTRSKPSIQCIRFSFLFIAVLFRDYLVIFFFLPEVSYGVQGILPIHKIPSLIYC